MHVYGRRHLAVATVKFAALAPLIAAGLYYLPNYDFLERWTAYHSSLLLPYLGIEGTYRVLGGLPYVNEFQIVTECTGIQVVAVFAGILLPLSLIGWRRKLLVIGLVSAGVYAANLGRIAFEIWLLYKGILPWDMAHGPVGVVLGIVSVMFLVLLADRFIPELGDFVYHAEEAVRKGLMLRLRRSMVRAGSLQDHSE